MKFDEFRESSRTLELFEHFDVQIRKWRICWFLMSYSSKTCLNCLKYIYSILSVHKKSERLTAI